MENAKKVLLGIYMLLGIPATAILYAWHFDFLHPSTTILALSFVFAAPEIIVVFFVTVFIVYPLQFVLKCLPLFQSVL